MNARRSSSTKPLESVQKLWSPISFVPLSFLALVLLSGCKSYWIDAEVINQTGDSIRELEVDYPTASFGVNSLAAGATMRYRFQVRGSGPVHVEYMRPDGKIMRIDGSILTEHQHGRLTIRLMPAGKGDFQPILEPASSQTVR